MRLIWSRKMGCTCKKCAVFLAYCQLYALYKCVTMRMRYQRVAAPKTRRGRGNAVNAQTVMICSGKGGTGKSTVSVLLGAALARLGKKTLLIELDSGLRSVDIIAGVYGRTVYDIEDVLCGRCEGTKAIIESPLYPGLSVISAPYEGGAVEAAPLARLVAAMRPYFDFILLDTAAGMGAPFTAAAAVARTALIVLTPDPVALRDGRIVADRLFGGRRVGEVRLVMNRTDAASFGKRAAVADLDECIDTVGAQLIAVIPESKELQLAAAAGTAPPDCPAVSAGNALAKRLCGQRVPLTVRR